MPDPAFPLIAAATLPVPSAEFFTGRLRRHGRPLLVLGPCSAESEAQVLTTARAAAALGAHMLRAGVWKPRSRPGSFEGAGEPALEWLARAKAETGLPIAVEVATPAHVEAALKAGVDVPWLGARTVVDPFRVQELADALRGTGVPVLVKNPVVPDLELWLGAIERLRRAGVGEVGAVHRGFSTGAGPDAHYRNAPRWALPIELRRREPTLPLLCDPSHIGGRRELIGPLSQHALDLAYDGLMIETHPDPDRALSDARQQLTPAALAEVLRGLVVRTEASGAPSYTPRAEFLREQIDGADRELVEALAARMRTVGEIGAHKQAHGVTVLQPERWREIFATRTTWAEELGLRPEFVQQLYELIHLESIRTQTSVGSADSTR